MKHLCHAHGCECFVPPRMFVCKKHWKRLRRPMQQAIWREYRPGQENDKRPSLRYLAVQRRAIAELAFRPNDEQAAGDAAPYFIDSEVYRVAAIKAGLGDPLEGLTPYPALVRPPDGGKGL